VAPLILRPTAPAHGGAAVARDDGKVWLVNYALPGEVVEAEPRGAFRRRNESVTHAREAQRIERQRRGLALLVRHRGGRFRQPAAFGEGDLLPANGCSSSPAMDVCELAAVDLDPVPIASRLLPIAATIVTAIGM